MTMNHARFGLLGIFALGLLLQLTAVALVGDKMWPEELRALITKILAIYSIPLTAVLGGIFAQPKGVLENPSAPIAGLALMLTVFWNLLLAWRSVYFSLAAEDSVRELVLYLDQVSSASSFLIAGVIAYFFTKETHAAG
jgi:hypothetical protein